MPHKIQPNTDRIQPQIHEGESARYRDVGYWRKRVAFINPPTDQPASKNIDFANLTALVEAEARVRFPKFDQFSKKRKKKSANRSPTAQLTGRISKKLHGSKQSYSKT